jgi:hypothetical protein
MTASVLSPNGARYGRVPIFRGLPISAPLRGLTDDCADVSQGFALGFPSAPLRGKNTSAPLPRDRRPDFPNTVKSDAPSRPASPILSQATSRRGEGHALTPCPSPATIAAHGARRGEPSALPPSPPLPSCRLRQAREGNDTPSPPAPLPSCRQRQAGEGRRRRQKSFPAPLDTLL